MFKKLITSMLNAKNTKAIEAQVKDKLLNRVPFLKGADDSLISDLAAAVDSLNFQEGDTIFNEGEQGDSLFLIVDGSVRVTSKGRLIAELGVGGCFGEGAVIQGEVRGATVLALEPVTLLQLHRESFAGLTEKYRKVRFRLRELHERRRAEDIEQSIERNLLDNAPFLAGAGRDLINELAHYLQRKSYASGEVLMQEGDEGSTLFLIEDGIVSISKSGATVAELGPGACVGEGVLFSRRARSATVTALTETSCFELGRSPFNRIISRYPVFGKRLRAIHAERVE